MPPLAFWRNLSKTRRVLLGLGLLVIAVLLCARLNASLGYAPAKTTVYAERPGATTLVVLVPGYTGNRAQMAPVVRAVQARQPNADVLLFDYAAPVFSNQDPYELAQALEEGIRQRYRLKPYEHIYLVGYSMGALLLRKAYVYGAGRIEDAPLAGGMPAARRPVADWVRRVDRLVLLAGMNRGWTLERAEKMTWSTYALNSLGMAIAKGSNTGHLIRQLERGEPFVANLRLQWLAVAAQARRRAEGLRPPAVIQLLGDRDDMVSAADSRDVAVAKDFVWVNVNNTGHADLLRFDDPVSGPERRRKFELALGSPDDVRELERRNVESPAAVDTAVTTAVMVVHGIRDMGEWTAAFDEPLQRAFARVRRDSTEKMYVDPQGYGYFPMGAFLVLPDRQRNVRWFMDEVTELYARFPKLRHLHFIGHSNGTYVLASALARYKTLRVERVVFAGSVVQRNYPWKDLFKGRVQQVRNYVGADDWVVALFPNLFELPGFHALNPDLGSAGFNGFTNDQVKHFETQFVRGGHGAALAPANVASIVDFVVEGKKTEPPASIRTGVHPGWLALLSKVCWVVWLALVALLGYAVWHAPTWAGAVWKRASPRTLTWGTRLACAGMIWLLLNTV